MGKRLNSNFGSSKESSAKLHQTQKRYSRIYGFFLIGLPSFTCLLADHPLRGIETVKGTANALHLYGEFSKLNANAFDASGQYVFLLPTR